jgi:hypothetical protein
MLYYVMLGWVGLGFVWLGWVRLGGFILGLVRLDCVWLSAFSLCWMGLV